MEFMRTKNLMVFALCGIFMCFSHCSGGSQDSQDDGTDSPDSGVSSGTVYLASQVENYDDDFDGQVDQKIYYTYDANGNETKREIDEENNGDINETHEFSYDDKNNVTKEIATEGSTTTTYTFETTYDSEDRVTTGKSYRDGELYEEWTFEYGYDDARGQYYRKGYAIDEEGMGIYVEKVFLDTEDFSLSSMQDHIIEGYALNDDSAYYKKYTRDEYHNLTALDEYEEYHSYDDINVTELATFMQEDLSADMQNFTWEIEYDSHGEFLVRSKLELSEQTNLRAFVNTYSDGSVTSFTDADGDTIPAAYDCDDTNSAITLRSEEGCDGIDGAVDDDVTTRTYYRDADNDNYGDLANPVDSYSQPDGYVTNDDDCDDDVNPGRTECTYVVSMGGDGKDNDCDGTVDEICTFNIPSF